MLVVLLAVCYPLVVSMSLAACCGAGCFFVAGYLMDGLILLVVFFMNNNYNIL
jgi:hypothetical protein